MNFGIFFNNIKFAGIGGGGGMELLILINKFPLGYVRSWREMEERRGLERGNEYDFQFYRNNKAHTSLRFTYIKGKHDTRPK